MDILSENVARGPLGSEVRLCPLKQSSGLCLYSCVPFCPGHLRQNSVYTLGKGSQTAWFSGACWTLMSLLQHAAQPWMSPGAQSSCESLSSGLPGFRSESAWQLSPWDSSPEVTIGQSGESSQPDPIRPI